MGCLFYIYKWRLKEICDILIWSRTNLEVPYTDLSCSIRGRSVPMATCCSRRRTCRRWSRRWSCCSRASPCQTLSPCRTPGLNARKRPVRKGLEIKMSKLKYFTLYSYYKKVAELMVPNAKGWQNLRKPFLAENAWSQIQRLIRRKYLSLF